MRRLSSKETSLILYSDERIVLKAIIKIEDDKGEKSIQEERVDRGESRHVMEIYMDTRAYENTDYQTVLCLLLNRTYEFTYVLVSENVTYQTQPEHGGILGTDDSDCRRKQKNAVNLPSLCLGEEYLKNTS